MNNPALNALNYHVTGAIERGERQPIVNVIGQSREGDFTITITDGGFSQDVDAMIVGWIYTMRQGDNQSRATGIMWDESRILVDCSQPLTPREIEALRSAGFMVDDTFLP